MPKGKLFVYTDGSCHTKLKKGAWAAIIINGKDEIELFGLVQSTTNNQLELLAVCEVIDYCIINFMDHLITIYSDSQFVIKLIERRVKLERSDFISSKGKVNSNKNLIKRFYSLLDIYDKLIFKKVKAHQQKTAKINYNRMVDLLCRKLMRESL